MIFRPKSGEEQKKKRSSLKFGPIFRPKSGEEQKKKVFTQIWSEFSPEAKKKRTEHSLCVIKPYAQLEKGGGACLNSACFSMKICNPGDPKGGGHGTMPPPKYAPAYLG